MNTTQAMYFLIVQTLAVVLAAVGVVATITWNRILVRRRATIDLLVADQTNETLLKARGDFVTASQDPEGLLEIVKGGVWMRPDKHFLVSTCNR
jgi:hypothetical protein